MGSENGFVRHPLPLGEGRGDGYKEVFQTQSCYDFQLLPSFETVSEPYGYSWCTPFGAFDATFTAVGRLTGSIAHRY